MAGRRLAGDENSRGRRAEKMIRKLPLVRMCQTGSPEETPNFASVDYRGIAGCDVAQMQEKRNNPACPCILKTDFVSKGGTDPNLTPCRFVVR
jgi:hypothetical protein